MAVATRKEPIDDLIGRGQWAAARKRIDRELKKTPDSHWLLTQKGVTLYEERRYREALDLFVASQRIVPDCPLTLWNLAGALDALGRPGTALSIYAWLLACKTTPAEDPCWESRSWADELKTDCVYRAGSALRHLGKSAAAEACYRAYIDLLLAGAKGTYPIEDAARHIREMRPQSIRRKSERESRQSVASVLANLGIEPSAEPPAVVAADDLLAG